MPLIIIDGCEKAGKTSTARIIEAEHGARYRHFGLPEVSPNPFDLLFYEPLVHDITQALAGELIVWDRSWASDSVYGNLMARTTRLTKDPWLGEWLYGRLAKTIGVCAMFLGPGVPQMERLRTIDDQPVAVADERLAFQAYAKTYQWWVYETQHDTQYQRALAAKLVSRARDSQKRTPMFPPDYVGPIRPQTLIVGESRNIDSKFPGAYAPFTSPYTTKYGQTLGNRVSEIGWTNADVVTDQLLKMPKRVIACGAKAALRVGNARVDFTRLVHPSFLYRFGAGHAIIDDVERVLFDTAFSDSPPERIRSTVQPFA